VARRIKLTASITPQRSMVMWNFNEDHAILISEGDAEDGGSFLRS